MRRTPAARLGAALAAAALLLAGCADDGEPRSDPTWSPTAVPESPSTTPADAATKPALPDAATKATKAGAEAFIQYYWDLINYAQLTGDVAPLGRASARTCDGCRAGETHIRKLYRNGGHLTGGAYAVQVAKLTEVRTEDDSVYAYEAKVRASIEQQVVTDGAGTKSTLAPGSNNMLMYVHWVQKAWRVDIMEVQ